MIMKTKIIFKVLQRGKVLFKTLSIEHPDYNIIPSEEFNGFELPPISIESQVIDYLDNIDKSDIMVKYDWDIILDYYPKKQRKRKKKINEVADFIEYMRPLVESFPDLQIPIEAVICLGKNELFGCRKSNLQKAKEVLKMLELSYVAATCAYRNIGDMFKDYKQNLIEYKEE